MAMMKLYIKWFSIVLLFTITVFAQDRLIRPGDTIDIVVYGHEELSRVTTVGANGSINFPFMQNIPVDGMSLEELRKFMVAQLSRYLESQPVVTVSFAESNMIVVSVLGHVTNPGTQQLPLVGTLQEALSIAGGPLPGANLESVNVLRENEGKLTRKQYNLHRLSLLGDLDQNPVLKDGDIVLVTGNSVFSSVKILGSVSDPGTYEPTQGATVLDMIFIAGGMTQDADIKNIRYVSPSAKRSKELEIDLDRYFKDPYNYELPRVQPGDIIVVPQKNQFWKGFLSVVGSVSSILSMVYLVTRIQNI